MYSSVSGFVIVGFFRRGTEYPAEGGTNAFFRTHHPRSPGSAASRELAGRQSEVKLAVEEMRVAYRIHGTEFS